MSTVFWNKFNIEVESSCFRLFSSIFLRLLTFDFTFWGKEMRPQSFCFAGVFYGLQFLHGEYPFSIMSLRELSE